MVVIGALDHATQLDRDFCLPSQRSILPCNFPCSQQLAIVSAFQYLTQQQYDGYTSQCIAPSRLSPCTPDFHM